MSRKKRVREKSRHLTGESRTIDENVTDGQSPQEAIFERAVDEAIAGLPFEEGGGFSYVFWRIRAGKPREYCGRYMPPPDLDLWHRELGAGDYQIQVQQHGKFTDFPAIKLTFGDRPGVNPATAAPSSTGQAGQAMQEILGALKDRLAVEAAKAAISDKQESFGAKDMLETFAAFKSLTPDTLSQMKAMVDLLGLKDRGEPVQAAKGPYDDIMATVLKTVVERGITGGGAEPSIGVEVVRALLTPETAREVGRTFQGIAAIIAGRAFAPSAVPPVPSGQIPTFREPPAPPGEIPPVSEQPTTGGGSTGTPQRGFDRLVQEMIVMVASGDKDFDYFAACADRWTPGLCEQIADAEKEAAVAHIVQTVPPLNTPPTIAWLNEFYDHLKRADQEGGSDAA